MSAAAVAPCSDDRLLLRLHALSEWLRGLGACGICALDMAFAQIEKENGGKFELRRTCVRRPDRTKCEDRAKAAWKTMPK